MKLDLTTEQATNLVVFFGRAWRGPNEVGAYEALREALNAGLQRMQSEAQIAEAIDGERGDE